MTASSDSDGTAPPTAGTGRRRWLTIVSTAQLGAALAGLAVCVRRRHPYDFLFLRGRADNVSWDALGMGTPLSAPALMLATQAAAIVQLARGRTGRPEQVLAGLGAAMVPGYLGEALVRRRLRRSGFDGVETPLAATGLGLAAAMAVLGMAGSWTRSRSRSVTLSGEPPLARAE